MPRVKTDRVTYPEGWELIEPTLRELQAKMREAENDPHDGKRKCEGIWPIFKISHQKSSYIFDLYHRRKEISKELYEFCLDQGYADKNVIAKWKKPGYERLCCLRCMQPRDHNFATTCVELSKITRPENDPAAGRIRVNILASRVILGSGQLIRQKIGLGSG